MWLKFVFLALYLVILVFLSILIDTLLLYRNGYLLSSATHVDSLALVVPQLKEILDARGVNYGDIDEKEHLARLVDRSGKVRIDEVQDLSDPIFLENVEQNLPPETKTLMSITQFIEEVEDVKDTSWLVMVKLPGGATLLDEASWASVTKIVSRFGIKTAIFDCSKDRGTCSTRKWDRPQLILSLPNRDPGNSKKGVGLNVFYNFNKPSYVISWVHKKLSTKVVRVKPDELTRWSSFDEEETAEDAPKVRILMVSSSPEPPLLLSTLAVKFTSRVEVGMVDGSHLKLVNSLFKQELVDTSSSAFIVITPKITSLYGSHAKESLNFRRFEIFLNFLVPESNNMFTLTLTLINILLTIELFLVNSCCVKHVISWMFRVVKYNGGLFLIWLAILGLLKFHWVDRLTESCLSVLRDFSFSYIGQLLRAHWPFVSSLRILALSVFLYGCVVGLGWYHCRPSSYVDRSPLFSEYPRRPSWSERSHILVNQLFRPVVTISNRPVASATQLDLDEGVELLIERLTVPNLWLPADVSAGYIKELPTWQFKVIEFDFDDSKSTSSMGSDSESLLHYAKFPEGMHPSLMCSICLERYRQEETLCGLPCGHNFHAVCVLGWLTRDHHCCPICRWPSHKAKSSKKSGHDA